MISTVILMFWFIAQDKDIWGRSNYYFSDKLILDKQFDATFKKIEATLNFDPVQI